jgi:hypothetical protein
LEKDMTISRDWLFGAIAVSAAIAWVGCAPSASTTGSAGSATAEHQEGGGHTHGEEGPHHGHIIELGKEEYHLELTHDDATKAVTVYVLDHAAKAAVPIAAKELVINLVIGGKPSQFVLPAAPQAGDPPEQSSCFQLADENLCDGSDAEGATGRINIEIAGKPYAGTIEHHAHGEHSHR